jgi:transcription initiation factor IIE alpha subunit
MISRDQRCVHVADHQHEVAFVLAILRDEGIEATATNEATHGGVEGLTGWIPRAGIKGIEIWVNDLDSVETARTILSQRLAEIQELRDARKTRTGTVDVMCTDCNQTSTFPAAQQGTVQSCPKCNAYVDVPDPDEEADWADLSEPTEDETEQ